jgi:hypothetical protein
MTKFVSRANCDGPYIARQPTESNAHNTQELYTMLMPTHFSSIAYPFKAPNLARVYGVSHLLKTVEIERIEPKFVERGIF